MLDVKEIKARLTQIKTMIPARHHPSVSLWINSGKFEEGKGWHCYVTGGHPLPQNLSIEAGTPEVAMETAQIRVEEWLLKMRNGIHRRMAMAIIEATADGQGTCNVAALKMAGFSDAEIAENGAGACDEADRLAAGGPFSIAPDVIEKPNYDPEIEGRIEAEEKREEAAAGGQFGMGS